MNKVLPYANINIDFLNCGREKPCFTVVIDRLGKKQTKTNCTKHKRHSFQILNFLLAQGCEEEEEERERERGRSFLFPQQWR